MTDTLPERLAEIRARLERHRSVGYPDTLFLLDALDTKTAENERLAKALEQADLRIGFAGEGVRNAR